jgi:hypothetical protein
LSAATAAAAAVSTAAAATLFARLGFVNRQRTAIVLLFVKRLDCGASTIVFAHLDESKALATTGFAILDHFGASDFTKLREQLLKIRAGYVVTKVTDVQFLTHYTDSVKTKRLT